MALYRRYKSLVRDRAGVIDAHQDKHRVKQPASNDGLGKKKTSRDTEASSDEGEAQEDENEGSEGEASGETFERQRKDWEWMCTRLEAKGDDTTVYQCLDQLANEVCHLSMREAFI
jgi:hypothetical protein